MKLIARHPRRRGFTLIEAAIVTAIVGIGIVSMVQLFAAGSMANIQSTELTTAVYLANNIDEMLQGATYSTLKSTYDNHTYDYPVDGTGTSLGSSFAGWKQVVSVQYVDHNLLTFVVPDTQVEPTSRVTVTVYHNGNPIYTASWNVVQPS
jgi:prepilin-type N-terminal cleavage/methylation domain-containing protein